MKTITTVSSEGFYFPPAGISLFLCVTDLVIGAVTIKIRSYIRVVKEM